MEKPSFVVRLADLERGPKKVTFALTAAWLGQALADTDAVAQEPGEATLELSKSGELVLVRGAARVKVTVPCVVTLDPLPFELTPEIELQLTQEPELPERPKSTAKTGDKKPADEAQKKRVRRGKRAPEAPELMLDEGPTDTFRGEEIALDGFLREFIVLEIPAYPRRSDLPSSEESISSRPFADPHAEAKPLDPRLAPLLGIANRIKGAKKE